MKETSGWKGEMIDTKTTKFWLVNAHILIAEPKKGADITLKDAIEGVAIVVKMAKSGKWVLVVDMRQVNSVTKEARDYYSNDDVASGRCGIAMLVNSYFSKIIANFFIAYAKPAYPIQLFTSKEKAIHWLKTLLKNGN